MLVWLDLETTGLNAQLDDVLEVACIVTDDDLNELARFQRVTDAARYRQLAGYDEIVQRMHLANGLWLESLQLYENPMDALDHRITSIDNALTKMIAEQWAKHGDPHPKAKPVAAGNNVWFDKLFVQRLMPSTYKLLHYRTFDVSALNEFHARFRKDTFATRPQATQAIHRAMPDIEMSLAVARHYKDAK